MLECCDSLFCTLALPVTRESLRYEDCTTDLATVEVFLNCNSVSLVYEGPFIIKVYKYGKLKQNVSKRSRTVLHISLPKFVFHVEYHFVDGLSDIQLPVLLYHKLVILGK